MTYFNFYNFHQKRFQNNCVTKYLFLHYYEIPRLTRIEVTFQQIQHQSSLFFLYLLTYYNLLNFPPTLITNFIGLTTSRRRTRKLRWFSNFKYIFSRSRHLQQFFSIFVMRLLAEYLHDGLHFNPPGVWHYNYRFKLFPLFWLMPQTKVFFNDFFNLDFLTTANVCDIRFCFSPLFRRSMIMDRDILRFFNLPIFRRVWL